MTDNLNQINTKEEGNYKKVDGKRIPRKPEECVKTAALTKVKKAPWRRKINIFKCMMQEIN